MHKAQRDMTKISISLIILLLIFGGIITVYKKVNESYQIDNVQILYNYKNGNTNRLIAWENNVNWIECSIYEGENCILIIPLIEDMRLESLILELRTQQEGIKLEGTLAVSALTFCFGNVEVYSVQDREEMEELFSLNWNERYNGIVVDGENDIPRLNLQLDGIKKINIISSEYLEHYKQREIAFFTGYILILSLLLYFELIKGIISIPYKKFIYPVLVRHQTYTAWILAFFLIGGYFILRRDTGFRGDAYAMWEVAKTYFNKENRYRSFVEYRSPIAFVVYGIFYKFSQWLNINDIAFYRIISAVIFSCLSATTIPALLLDVGKEQQTESHERKLLICRIFFVLLMYYFFRGYFLMPFTDYWGLFFLILALSNVKKSFYALDNSKEKHGWLFLIRGG